MSASTPTTTPRTKTPRGLHQGRCEQCLEEGLVQDFVESLRSDKLEGVFCSSECANAHQLARLGRLI